MPRLALPSLAPLALVSSLAVAVPASPPRPADAAPSRAPVSAPGVVRIAVEDADGLCELAVEAPVARFSEERLRALARLSDAFADTWVREMLQVETSPWLHTPSRVERELPTMEALLARFDAAMAAAAPPPELAPAVRWTRDALAFRIWLVRAELDFCKGDASALRRTFGALEAGRTCARAIEKVLSLAPGQRCREASYEWGNCATGAWAAAAGALPRAAWDAFARASGITVRRLRCDEP